jgi:hypothetical protein
MAELTWADAFRLWVMKGLMEFGIFLAILVLIAVVVGVDAIRTHYRTRKHADVDELVASKRKGDWP